MASFFVEFTLFFGKSYRNFVNYFFSRSAEKFLEGTLCKAIKLAGISFSKNEVSKKVRVSSTHENFSKVESIEYGEKLTSNFYPEKNNMVCHKKFGILSAQIFLDSEGVSRYL